jgi:hypothetical protein
LKSTIVGVVLVVLMGILIVVAGYLYLKQTECTPVIQGIEQFATVKATALYTDIKNKNYNYAQQLSYLNEHVFPKLFELSEIVNELFMRQVWEHNEKVFQGIQSSFKKTCEGTLYEMYELNAGPWDRLNNNTYYLSPFISSLTKYTETPVESTVKPLGANFYPSDLTRAEFDQWTNSLNKSSQEYLDAVNYYHVIRRDNGHLKAVPYSEEFKELLKEAHDILIEVAEALESQPETEQLIHFLKARAQSFLNNDYDTSDIAWLDVTDKNSLLEVTVGPYETYEDELRGLKAAFEIYVGIRDAHESSKLEKISTLLPKINEALPLDAEFRTPEVAGNYSRVIRVVDQLMNGGEARSSIQTAAYNLPNSAKVTTEHGSKRVLLKNIQRAKYDKALVPISAHVTGKIQKPFLNFNAFFTHIMAHEVMHGLGPQYATITVDELQVSIPVNQVLEEIHPIIEEAKADVGGLWMLSHIINNNLMEFQFNFTASVHELEEKYNFKEQEMVKRSIYTTFVANIFRSIRFGEDAHAKASSLIFNFFKRRNALTLERELPESGESGAGEGHENIENEEVLRVNVNFATVEGVAQDLLRELMTIQAKGNKKAAEDLIAEYAVDSEDLAPIKEQLDAVDANSINKIPVDIRVVYDNNIFIKK